MRVSFLLLGLSLHFALLLPAISHAQSSEQLIDYDSRTKLISLPQSSYYKLSQFNYPKLRVAGVSVEETKSNIAYFELSDSQVDTIHMYRSYNYVRLIHVISNVLEINSESSLYVFIGELKMQDSCKFEHLKISNSDVMDMVLDEVRITSDLLISNSNITGRSFMYLIPESSQITVRFDKVDVEGSLRIQVYNPRPSIVLLNYNQTNFENIDIDYYAFKLTFDSSDHLSLDQKNGIYNELLASFKKKGRQDSYEKLDKEYREWKYLREGDWYGHVLNWVDKVWWDYGYNKFLVFRASAVLMGLFFFVNILLFDKLVNDVYSLPQFKEANDGLKSSGSTSNGLAKLLRKAVYVLLYTGYIFWGWKLDLVNFKVHHVLLFGYVLIQYLLGIVCLAYIINIVITV